MSYRMKDFISMKVYDDKGIFRGRVKDIALDYYNEKIIGFIVNPKMLSNRNYVDITDLISIDGCIIVRRIQNKKEFSFDDIKGMEVINKFGKMLGVIEDILVDLMNFNIKGLIVSTGFLDKIFYGKKIILIKNTILGDSEMLYCGDEKIILTSVPHNFLKREECYEKNL
ncbi:Uncharacterized protein YrrD, contains PRC-barrel domain [Clostridium cavendishii DSM 21758]|uniref:Uncharacterized protein YrrD, contains PRC-barrel domain n=1 Tax=Clostridium cavendishii DSM 21758 TaxID=1121302 RepID=A0A1M6KFU7_9CLOT|nr:PRC-barrel domain-containing protein [Clostridium cavendishii]SHJ57770.1 Uncharacterized protein YrrD, contains PRC-barrel domain [Clostridium cavendishii DSM 21758]